MGLIKWNKFIYFKSYDSNILRVLIKKVIINLYIVLFLFEG